MRPTTRNLSHWRRIQGNQSSEVYLSVFLGYEELDFNGITAAFFGCGDQTGYPDNFLDAIGILAKPFMENDGTLIGRWPTEGYEFDLSLAQDGDSLFEKYNQNK